MQRDKATELEQIKNETQPNDIFNIIYNNRLTNKKKDKSFMRNAHSKLADIHSSMFGLACSLSENNAIKFLKSKTMMSQLDAGEVVLLISRQMQAYLKLSDAEQAKIGKFVEQLIPENSQKPVELYQFQLNCLMNVIESIAICNNDIKYNPENKELKGILEKLNRLHAETKKALSEGTLDDNKMQQINKSASSYIGEIIAAVDHTEAHAVAHEVAEIKASPIIQEPVQSQEKTYSSDDRRIKDLRKHLIDIQLHYDARKSKYNYNVQNTYKGSLSAGTQTAISTEVQKALDLIKPGNTAITEKEIKEACTLIEKISIKIQPERDFLHRTFSKSGFWGTELSEIRNIAKSIFPNDPNLLKTIQNEAKKQVKDQVKESEKKNVEPIKPLNTSKN